MGKFFNSFAGLVVAWLINSHAGASPIAVTGNVSIIAPPPSVLFGQLQSNTSAFVFAETKGVFFPGFTALVNSSKATTQGLGFLTAHFDETTFPGFIHADSGFVDSASALHFVAPTVAAPMDSYFLHFEPQPSQTASAYMAIGSLRFDSDIVGVQVAASGFPAAFELSTIPFESDSTEYGNTFGGAGHLELELSGSACGELNDTFEISVDRRLLSFCFSANGSADQLRILTAASADEPSAVPEPSSLALLSLAFGAFAGARRRNTRKVVLSRDFLK